MVREKLPGEKLYILLSLTTAILLFATEAEAQFNYMINSQGPHHVTQGHRIYFNLQCTRLDTLGNADFEDIWTTLGNLPPNATLDWGDFATNEPAGYDPVLGYKQYGCYTYNAIGILAAANTPPGTYAVNVICTSSNSFVVKQIPYIIIVDPAQPLPVPPLNFCKLAPIPDSVEFVSSLKSIGQNFCRDTVDMMWDYDPTLTYYEISDYLKDSTSWLPCMRTGRYVNRDMTQAYDDRIGNPGKGLGIIPADGIRPAYYIFSEGLYEDYVRTGDTLSKYGVELFASKSNYADPPQYGDPLAWVLTGDESRSTAYNLRSFIKCHDMGLTLHDNRMNEYLDLCFGQMDQWFSAYNTDYTRPFMVGLTIKTLIMYYNEINKDNRVFPAVKMAVDSLWKNFFVPGVNADAFEYTDIYTSSGVNNPYSDLSMLVGPAYAWLYSQTGDTSYINKADTLFAGMIRQISQWDSKMFCQEFQWTFDYINWRNNNPVDPSCAGSRLSPLAVQENNLVNSLELMPNPSSTNVNIKYTLASDQDVRIDLVDVTGKEVSMIRYSDDAAGEHQINLDVSTLAKGIYFLKFNTDFQKLVVQ